MNEPRTLGELVREYWKDECCGPSLQEYLDYFQGLPSLADAIRLAGYREDGATVHDHQRLVGKKRLNQASQSLHRRIGKIEACKTFAELHYLINECAASIHGFGVLASYDYALRIGANLGLWPVVVYLHAGTRTGCKVLGVTFNGNTVKTTALPKAVQKLKPHHAENFLCIYKGCFTVPGRKPERC